MVMSEDHKKKIAAGVKAYHECAKSKGCGKQKETKPKKEKKPQPPKKEKPKTERPQPPKPRILALEDIQEKTKPKKEKKNYKINRAKRGEVNRALESQYKKPAHKILGVAFNASPEEIKKKMRTYLKFHPDKRTGNLALFQKYSAAYSGMLSTIDIIG
jgi:hypothetical protein